VLDNHHIKFFTDVYKEKHLLLLNHVLCQSKQTEEVSPVTYPIRHKNDLSENQEYLKMTTNERKDDKLPQKYM
jgi:hypothetical protein